jgi:hypothetical protein
MLPIEDDADESFREETSSKHPDFEIINFGIGMFSIELLLDAKDSVLEEMDVDISSFLFHDVNHLYSFYKIYFLGFFIGTNEIK